MIAMNLYSKEFKEEYYKKVAKIIDQETRAKIISSCKKYFPPDFGWKDDNGDADFKLLILLPYEELKIVYGNITKTSATIMEEECFSIANELSSLRNLYKNLHNAYEAVRDSQINKMKMNVKLIKESGMLTCPYCNRDYINSRGVAAAGGQLDHFYSRSKYPIFSVCLYNLIPSCANCNRIKSNTANAIVSPFDSEVDFNEDITFTYEPCEMPKVLINAKGVLVNNIDIMKLREAYAVHGIDIKGLIDKAEIYNKTQQKEIEELLIKNNIDIAGGEIRRLIFGNKVEMEEFSKKPLSKLTFDILKELKIEI